MPLILCVYSSGLDTKCLNYTACYEDQYIDWNYVDVTLESRHEERSAVTCAVECLQRNPDTQLVLVKLVGVDELLNCSCGSDLAMLGNGAEQQDNYDCYVCPDVENQKCGSDKTYSLYLVHHYVNDDPSCNGGFYIDWKTTNSSTTTIMPTSTANNNSSFNLSLHHNSSAFPIDNTTTATTIMPLDSLRFIGCYDEERVNESQVLTLYLEGEGVGVLDCYQNCSHLHPETPDLLVLVKLLKSDRVYCGCR